MTSDAQAEKAPSKNRLEFLFDLRVKVGAIVTLGAAPYGERRVVPILGGDLRGPGVSGMVVPGGEDWQIMRADGILDIDAHYVLKMHDDALIEVRSQGYRYGPADVMERMARGEAVPPGAYFFRSVLRFQTGSASFAHLNHTIAIAYGERQPDCVLLTVEKIV